MDEQKAAPPVLKWAIITVHKALPSQEDQLAGAFVWGLRKGKIGDDIQVGPFTLENVSKVKTTNWPANLPMRASFIARRKLEAEEGIEGVEVFFLTPLCVGFSRAHAEMTVRALWDAKSAVYVHTLARTYRAGDDLEDLLEKVEKEANSAHARISRQRKAAKEAKKKDKAEAKRLAAERNANT